MTERWVTAAEVIAARDRLEQALGGWQRPAAYAIATGSPEEVVFWRVNVGDHPLPAVVLATVTGYRGGPASHQLSAATLDEAIAMLAPAEACTEYDHPNLFAWRHLRAELDDNSHATVVFLVALTDSSADPYVQALLNTVHIGKHENADGTTTLWRPVGQAELDLVLKSGEWPPRLPDQPIFYPVLSEQYAIAIASDWNVNACGIGYVTRFRVKTEHARQYASQKAGGKDILELWIPAEELAEFNTHIVGPIEVTHEFRSAGDATS